MSLQSTCTEVKYETIKINFLATQTKYKLKHCAETQLDQESPQPISN